MPINRQSIRPVFVFLTISLFILSCRNNYNEFSPTTQQFQDSVKGELALCFYPSTIRMLNFNKDSAFNDLIDDIKKLKIVSYNKQSDTTKTIDLSILTQKIREEGYVDLLQFKQSNRDIKVFLLKKSNEPKKFYGIINDSAQIILIDLVGKIPIKNLAALTSGKVNFSGFQSVLNFTKPSIKNKHKKN
jgi:hypothetical protein